MAEPMVGKGPLRMTGGKAIMYVRDSLLAINAIYLVLGLGLIALPFGMPGKWFGTMMLILIVIFAVTKIIYNWMYKPSLLDGFEFWKRKEFA